MSDNESDNEPDSKRLRQDDEENENVNDGNVSDASDASNEQGDVDAHDSDADDANSSDSGDASDGSEDLSDESDDENDNDDNGGLPPGAAGLHIQIQLVDPNTPFENSVDGNIVRMRIRTDQWADSSFVVTYHEDQIELVVEGILTMTINIVAPDGNFDVNSIQLRKTDEGFDIEFPGPPGGL